MRAGFEALRTLGYGGASSRAIGRLAGLNPALVYYYFDSVDDLVESGHLIAVSELVAASVARPQLADRVTALMDPWIELAGQAVDRVLRGTALADLASTRSLAQAGVVFYLGANLLARLRPQSNDIASLFDDAARVAPLVDGLREEAKRA